MTETSDKLQVAVRIRPRLDKFGEKFAAKCCSKNAGTGPMEVLNMAHPTDESFRHRPQVFQFDFVFDEDDSQADIYDAACTSIIDSCILGNPGTIMSYGQTGSGKTHTILGDIDEKTGDTISSSGIFPRTMADLFRFKNGSPNHVIIVISMLEIYNENIRDLLGKGKHVQLRMLPSDDVVTVGLTPVKCETLSEAIAYYKEAAASRKVASTQMNNASSRSHACFLIDLFQQTKTQSNPNPPDVLSLLKYEWGSNNNEDDEPSTTSPCELAGMDHSMPPLVRSRISLIDLAGSERVKRSGAEGSLLKEAQAINTSLSCLGTVVSGLYKGDKYINYRDSKLTLLLKSALSNPRAKILLITNLSPTEDSFQESLTSVRFADRVKGIKPDNMTSNFTTASDELEYLQNLKELTELSSDMRICMATEGYTPQIRKLRQQSKQEGKIWKRNVANISAEVTKLINLQKKEQFDQLVQRYANRRKIVEPREKLMIAIEEEELKLQQLELEEQSAKFDIMVRDEVMSHMKEYLDKLKTIRKSFEKEKNEKLVPIKDKLYQAPTYIHSAFLTLHESSEEVRKILEEMEADDPPPIETPKETEGINNVIKLENNTYRKNSITKPLTNSEAIALDYVENRSFDSEYKMPMTLVNDGGVSLPDEMDVDTTTIVKFDTSNVERDFFGCELRPFIRTQVPPENGATEWTGERLDLKTYIGHMARVYRTSVSFDGNLIASASKDQTVKIWNLQTTNLIHTLRGHTAAVLSCCFSPNEDQLISSSDDQTIRKWEASTGRKLFTMEGHTNAVYYCVYSPNGQEIASASGDKTVRIWLSKSGKKVCVLKGHMGAVFSVCFSPDNKKVISASNDQTIRIWDWNKKEQLFKLDEFSFNCVYSPVDSNVWLSASRDCTVKIWRMNSSGFPEVIGLMRGHTGPAYHAVWTSDAKYIVSCSGDRTLKVWDVASGRELATLRGHLNTIYHCSNHSHLVISCSGEVVKLWDISRIIST